MHVLLTKNKKTCWGSATLLSGGGLGIEAVCRAININEQISQLVIFALSVFAVG